MPLLQLPAAAETVGLKSTVGSPPWQAAPSLLELASESPCLVISKADPSQVSFPISPSWLLDAYTTSPPKPYIAPTVSVEPQPDGFESIS